MTTLLPYDDVTSKILQTQHAKRSLLFMSLRIKIKTKVIRIILKTLSDFTAANREITVFWDKLVDPSEALPNNTALYVSSP
jgi:hypothetical protein